MTRAEIIAELRRSAREDDDAIIGLALDAWLATVEIREDGELLDNLTDLGCRIFCEFVACALEDEC